MTLIRQAVLIMLATVVSNLVESTDLPPVPEDSNHTAKLEGSEPLPLSPEHYKLEPTAILPHERAYGQPRTVYRDRYVTKTERNFATTVTTTVIISPTVVAELPEVPELPTDYCNGPGQFLFGATNECFLYLRDGLRSFEDADDECRKGGMRLAKPKKPKAIQKYLVTVLGHSGHVWLGARGDGQSFVWQTNDGATIRNTDPMWWTGMPAYYITNDHCLALVAYPNAVKKEKVFYPEICSLKRTALCQREECSPQCTMGTCTGPNTCVYDPRSEAICPNGCGNGQCTGPNECTCSDGYEGNTCDKPNNEGDGDADGNTDGRPEGTPDGLFYFAQSDQWFLFPNNSYNRYNRWNASYDYCTSLGLEMAKPNDPIKLTAYLQHNYGIGSTPDMLQHTWLGARGTGSGINWIREGESMSRSGPLWTNSANSNKIKTDQCLLLLTGTTYGPNRPYAMEPCKYLMRVLCEYVKKENS